MFATKNLDYSDGLQYSRYERCPSVSNPGCGPGDGGRRVPTLRADGYNRHQEFLTWAAANGYADRPPRYMLCCPGITPTCASPSTSATSTATAR